MKKRVRIISTFLIMVMTFVTSAYAKNLIPVGRVAGIKIAIDGAVIVKVSEVETSNGLVSPAKDAGFVEGDIIKKINSKIILSNEDLQSVLNSANGEDLEISCLRNDKEVTAKVIPVKSVSGSYKIGVMVRDSMAGIGTITYVDPEKNTYGSLGHGISDSDTEQVIPIRDGSITEAKVSGVNKGEVGSPGELQGEFEESNNIGTIETNTENGIFGHFSSKNYFQGISSVETVPRDGVQVGDIKIMSNVEGKTTDLYSAEITKIYPADDIEERSFMIQITDKRLIDKTGGIVQGMSGSPILQNGKLIGAVTHVMVNDPQKGYGIFIDKMIGESENIAA